MNKDEEMQKNIKYSLHESGFLNLKRKGNDVTLKASINCFIDKSLGINCDYGEYYYIYDIIFKNCDIDISKYKISEMVGTEIVDLYVDNGQYVLYIEFTDSSSDKDDNFPLFITFYCSNIEWIPIKLVTGDELTEIENLDLDTKLLDDSEIIIQ